AGWSAVRVILEQVTIDDGLIGAAGVGQEQTGDVVLNNVVQDLCTGNAGHDVNAGAGDKRAGVALNGEAIDGDIARADLQFGVSIGTLDNRLGTGTSRRRDARLGSLQRDLLVGVH